MSDAQTGGNPPAGSEDYERTAAQGEDDFQRNEQIAFLGGAGGQLDSGAAPRERGPEDPDAIGETELGSVDLGATAAAVEGEAPGANMRVEKDS